MLCIYLGRIKAKAEDEHMVSGACMHDFSALDQQMKKVSYWLYLRQARLPISSLDGVDTILSCISVRVSG